MQVNVKCHFFLMIVDSKIIDDQGKGDGIRMMSIQTGGMFAFGQSEFVEIFIQSLVCEEASLW